MSNLIKQAASGLEDGEPKTDSDRLRMIASWFDAEERGRNWSGSRSVQIFLRRLAADLEDKR